MGTMSDARPIVKEQQYMITRSITQRLFLLTPSCVINNIMAYCLAVAAAKTGMLIHYFCVMSNHYHAYVTDPEGRIPKFTQEFHAMVADCVKAHLGHKENVWRASTQPNMVALNSDQDALREITYIQCNPVSAGTVRFGSRWPGLRTASDEFTRPPRVIKRPEVYFSDTGTMPKEVELKLTRPAIFTDLGDEPFVALVREAVTRREQELQAEMAQEGRRFLGAKAVLSQDPYDRPSTEQKRGGVTPRVAAMDKRLRAEMLARLKAFAKAYSAAYRAWREGHHEVVFPMGTYAMRVFHGVACEDSS